MKLLTNYQRILNELFKQEFRNNGVYSDESQFFEFFSANSILKKREFSDEEIESGVLGSGNDGGCDAVYVLYNGDIISEDMLEGFSAKKGATIELIIVQAKRESSFKEDALMKWKATTSNLLEIDVDDSKYENRYNEDLRAAFSLFRNLYVKLITVTPIIRISYHYASFAKEIPTNVQAQADELVQLVYSLYPSTKTTTVNVTFWGAKELFLAAQSQPEHKIKLSLAENSINVGDHQDYVVLVNLAKYYQFISDDEGKLRKYIFEANVRDYQGHTAVNSDIQNTLENSTGEDFWWLNNGITILTDEVIPATNKELVLTEPAVVNGLQTSTEIYRYFQANPDQLSTEKRNVLIRIISPESDDSRDRIILATNNQTTIPKSSLRANDPIHLQIELYLKGRGLYYDRRKNFYKNQGKKSKDIVSVSFLSQCMISLLLHRPDYARARPSTLLTKDETYNILYNNTLDINVFFNAAKLGKMVEITLKQDTQYTQAQVNDIMFYTLYYCVANKLRKSNIDDSDIQNLNLDEFTSEIIKEAGDFVYSEYQNLGGTSKIAKGPALIESIIAKLDASQA